MDPGSGADLRYTGDERSDTDEGSRGSRCRKNKKSDKNSMAENLNRKSTATRLARMEVNLMMIATISPTGRKVEATAVKQRTADEYFDEIGIRTRMFPLGSLSPHYRNFGPIEWS